MVRKFFAVFFLFIFVFIEFVVLVMYSVAHTYLNEKTFLNYLIPQSYTHVLDVVSHELASRTGDRKENVFSRIQQAFPQKSYTEIFQLGVQPFFKVTTAQDAVFIIDLTLFKQRLIEEVPQILSRLPVCTPQEYAALQADNFRLCLIAGEENEILQSRLQNSINTEIAPRLHLTAADTIARIIHILQKYLLLIACGVGVFLLIVIALLGGPALKKHFQYMAYAFLALTFSLLILSVVLWKETWILQTTAKIPSVYYGMVDFLIASPRFFLTYILFIPFFLGLACVSFSFAFSSRTKIL